MLPAVGITTHSWIDQRGDRTWDCRLAGLDYYEASAATEANARAKLLVYLYENKLITLP
jgi:hypothetical protein